MNAALPRAALLRPLTAPRLPMVESGAFDEIDDLIDQLVMEAAAEGHHLALRTGHPERDESFDVDLFKIQLRAACVKVVEGELAYAEEALLADHARMRTLLNRRPSKAGSASGEGSASMTSKLKTIVGALLIAAVLCLGTTLTGPDDTETAQAVQDDLAQAIATAGGQP